MKTLTPIQASVAKFASKSDMRPELASVHFDGVTATATDSFRMVAITNIAPGGPEASEPILINAKRLTDAKIKKTSGTVEGGRLEVDGTSYFLGDSPDASKYPVVERVWEMGAPTKQSIEVRLNGAMLAEIALALSKIDPFNAITLQVTPGQKPILLTAKGSGHSARAVLMPMNA